MTLIPEVHQELRDAVLKRQRTRRRPVLISSAAAAVALAIAIVVFVALAASPAGGPVDVLGRAEAALSTSGQLVHYSVTATAVDPSGGLTPKRIEDRCSSARTTEVWETGQPHRWRAVLPPPPSRSCYSLVDADGNVLRGPQQQSWADGVSTTYVPANRTLRIVRGYKPTSYQGIVPIDDPSGQHVLGGGGPVQGIRGLIEDGTLKDTGDGTVRGQRVRVLVGHLNRPNRGLEVETDLHYAVDAETFEPVRAITTTTMTFKAEKLGPPAGTVRRSAVQLDFSAFQRRELTGDTRRLLTIRPSAGPLKKTDQTLSEFRRSIKTKR